MEDTPLYVPLKYFLCESISSLSLDRNNFFTFARALFSCFLPILSILSIIIESTHSGVLLICSFRNVMVTSLVVLQFSFLISGIPCNKMLLHVPLLILMLVWLLLPLIGVFC